MDAFIQPDIFDVNNKYFSKNKTKCAKLKKVNNNEKPSTFFSNKKK